ncbi:hypothetical protein BG006_009204 [Podila minutissima]|uniref:Uncharacterized protein n=1 Tax=Podila minutissima TaxID=64525 RepID=A0A9P5SRS6_9FUNG|nr:hypothetical protein BG006_009204 [Podila minutissima]
MDGSIASSEEFIPLEPPSDLDSESDVDINMETIITKKKDHPKVPKHYRKSNPTIYDNISVYAPPDSNLIFRCSRKKADWYLTRNLARSISPTSIHLTFSPAGQGRVGDSYFLEARENKCVVCGKETAEAGATMLHVVPEQYRKWFPLKLKSHSSHDILVACPECNAQWDREAAAVRKMIVALYEVPLEGVGWVRDYEAGSAKRAAGAIVADWTRRWEEYKQQQLQNPERDSASMSIMEEKTDVSNKGKCGKAKKVKKQGVIPLERLKMLEQNVMAWWEQLPTKDRKDPSALKRSNILDGNHHSDHPNDDAGSRKKIKLEQPGGYEQADQEQRQHGKNAVPTFSLSYSSSPPFLFKAPNQESSESRPEVAVIAPPPPPGHSTVLSQTMLERAMDAQALYKAADYKEHGQIVVGRVMASSPQFHSDANESPETLQGWRGSVPLEDAPPGWTDVAAFVRTWRQAFLDKIKPRHLSAEWRPENPV